MLWLLMLKNDSEQNFLIDSLLLGVVEILYDFT